MIGHPESMDITADLEYQSKLLPGVSRTFALTIPQLPTPLGTVVTNAYLLCRIADTIEDDSNLKPDQKAYFHQQFREVLTTGTGDTSFVENLLLYLSPSTPPAELKLIEQFSVVMHCFRSFTKTQQESLKRCITIMSSGMPEFQRTASLAGLQNGASMDRYCYCVAGVVGEMLTEIFCEYSPQINKNRDKLMPLAVSFGQGLQMTNILKDFWEDRERNVCWLPADVFKSVGLDLTTWEPGQKQEEFNQAYKTLVLTALKHLQNAVEYTVLIPKNETGIRRFTFWSIGLAAQTLDNIFHNPYFKSGNEVKISRNMLKAIILFSNASCHSNHLLHYFFTFLIRRMK